MNPNADLTLLEFWHKCRNAMGVESFAIAGGAVSSVLLNDKPRDIDCFFLSEDDYLLAEIALRGHLEYQLVKERTNSLKFKHETEDFWIDIVRPKKDAQGNERSFFELTQDFDFIHVCMFYTPDHGIVEVVNGAMDCNTRKIIKIHVITLPYHSLGRAAKYKHRGFMIGGNEERQMLDYCYKAHWGATAEAEYNL